MSANLVFDPFRTGASMSETALLLTKHILNFRIEKLRLEPQNRTERLDQVTRWVFLASFTQGNQCWRSCHGLAEFLLSQRLKFTRNLQSPPPENITRTGFPQQSVMCQRSGHGRYFFCSRLGCSSFFCSSVPIGSTVGASTSIGLLSIGTTLLGVTANGIT